MNTLFTKLFDQHELNGLTVIAGSALYDNQEVGDRAISLPVNYTDEQRQVFEDTISTIPENTLTFATLWLSDGGYMEYYSENTEWQYIPPAPPIPQFPNTQQLDCLYNAVVDAQYGINPDKPTIEYVSTPRPDGLFDAVIKIKGRNKEQVQALADELVKGAHGLGIADARIDISEE